MRIFYFLTNLEQQTDKYSFAIKKINNEDKDILFDQTMLNVLNEKTYQEQSRKKFCYALKLEIKKSLLNDLKKLFLEITVNASDTEIIFDAGNKRFINKEELDYFSQNFIYLTKLFNLEITVFDKHQTQIKTKGLASLNLDEVKIYLNNGYNADLVNKFKHLIINYILTGKLEMFSYYEECKIVDQEELSKVSLENHDIVDIQKQKLLFDNFSKFLNYYKYKEEDHKFFINDQEISIQEIDNYKNKKLTYFNFKNHITSYQIQTKDLTYDHLNLFYYNKYKK